MKVEFATREDVVAFLERHHADAVLAFQGGATYMEWDLPGRAWPFIKAEPRRLFAEFDVYRGHVYLGREHVATLAEVSSRAPAPPSGKWWRVLP